MSKYKNSDDLIYQYEVDGVKQSVGFSKKSIAKQAEADFIANHEHLAQTVKNPLGLTEAQMKEVYGLAVPKEEVASVEENMSGEPGEGVQLQNELDNGAPITGRKRR